ncbi:MAG TPA: hypothetical protein VMT54_06090 [Candidatus Cybelea sp.]|nr:hypothetical protein [Candidatus Cybelea sp.]
MVKQADKLDFLRRPSNYPDPASGVEVIETHMSWVFLAGHYAYKLKKPVRYDFLDFSTVELRKRSCQEELRLNRRLAPKVYLAVVPLAMNPWGNLKIDGPGPAVDWLVKMQRLPAHRMLDSVIRAGGLLRSDRERLVALMDDFYRFAPRVELAPGLYRQKLQAGIEGNRTELLRYAPASLEPLIRAVADAQLAYLSRELRRVEQRAEGEHIVEGHGDLRPEHVFVGPPVQVIDCLEFEREFRVVDVADELASLAMECDGLGEPSLGRALFEIDSAATASPDLLAFYKSCRALLRARLAIWHLKELDIAEPAAWQARAKTYVELADQERAGLF